MMKKIYIFLLLALLALLMCGTAFACPYEDCDGNTYTYEFVDQNYHRLVCTVCGRGTVDAHNNADATCLEGETCTICKHVFSSPLGHDLLYIPDGNATCTADGTKTNRCQRTGCNYVGDTVADAGSAGHVWGDYISNHDATCVEDGTKTIHCLRTDCTATNGTVTDEGSALGHDWAAFVSNDDGTQTRACRRAGCTETDTAIEDDCKNHIWGAYISNHDASCTQDGTKTSICTNKVWCVKTNTVTDTGSALGHDYKTITTNSTCTQEGVAAVICARCNDSEIVRSAPLGHWYTLWAYAQDGTHTAACRRSDCDHTHTVPCTGYTVAAGDTVLSVCPVCGNMDGRAFEALDAAAASMNNGYAALPEFGELIVRGLEAPFDGALYALTVAHECIGIVNDFTGVVRVDVHLPAGLPAFRLVRVDAADADAGRTETYVEIPCTFEDGVLSFRTNTAGLFLLLPLE